MKQTIFSRKENDVVKKVIQGTVKSINEGTGKAKDKVIKVEIESDVYDSEKHTNVPTIYKFDVWNNESSKTADNFKKYVSPGNFISALIVEKGDVHTAYKFSKNNVLYKFEAIPASESNPKNMPEYNILVGTVGNGGMSADGSHYFTSMKFDKHVKDAGEDGSISISLWNGNKSNPKLADNAKKCLAPYQPKDEDAKKVYRRAAFVCTSISSYMDKNDEVKASCNAYSFDRS